MNDRSARRLSRVSRLAVAALAACLLLATSGGCAGDAGERRLSCFVSIPPQAFLLQRIAGPHVEVHALLAPGQSPHTYEPTPRVLAELSESRVYFTIGIAFEEPLVERIGRSFEGVRIVDSAAGIQKRTVAHVHHEGGGDGASSGALPARPEDDAPHGTLDPHVWLSPRLAATIARTMCEALAELDPGRSTEYRENLRRLVMELEDVDREIARMLEPHRGRAIFVFHPAYGYFTDAYGLRQIEIEKEGRAPGPRHLVEVIEQARAERAGAVFVQPQVSTTQAAMVAGEIGADLVELDPLAPDYIENLRAIARAVAGVLEGKP